MLNKIFILLFFLNFIAYAQYNEKRFAVSADVIYTTSSKVYLYPNSSDLILRNKAFPIDDIVNPAVDFRYRLNDDLFLGLDVEYMTKSLSAKNLTVFYNNKTMAISVEDGFILVPIELSIYYLLPFSTERWKFLMGGGAAYYYGEQIRKFGDEEVKSSPRNFAYGIQVSVGTEYLLSDEFGIRTSMKFRDPQFTVNNTYSRSNVNYDGMLITVPQKSFESKINVDGVAFLLGMSYAF